MSKKRNIFNVKSPLNKKINLLEQDNMIKERVENANKELGIKESIVSLEPSNIDTWLIRDRADFELGDIDGLAISIQNKGQAQPIIVVKKSDIFKPKSNEEARYIVIAGYRRWKACISHNIKIDTIIKDYTFDQAVACLEAENEKESVSEYSKGLFYSRLKEEHGYSLDKLSKRLGIAISKLNRYVSFSKVPSELWESVGNLKEVSSRTSSEILEMINTNPDALAFFLTISDKIAIGYGHTRLRKLYEESKLSQKEQSVDIIRATKKDIKINLVSLNLSNESRDLLIKKINTIIETYR